MSIDLRLLVSLTSACFFAAPIARAQGSEPAAPAPKAGPAAPRPAAPAPAGAASAPAAAAPAPAAPAPSGAPPAPPGAIPAEQPGAVPYYQEQPSEPAPAIYVAQPPLPPIMPRTRYYHDGFYLRLSTGFGYLHVSTSVDGNDTTGSVSGGGTSFDIMIGGTPAPGLVVGGGLLYQNAFDPSRSITRRGTAVSGIDSGSSGDVPLILIGPMIDAFPAPTGGFHLGGLLGLAGVGLNDNQDNFSGGLGLGIWTGYMWWVSGQWSLGAMLKFDAAWTRRKIGEQANQFDASDTSTGFTLSFSAAYH